MNRPLFNISGLKDRDGTPLVATAIFSNIDFKLPDDFCGFSQEQKDYLSEFGEFSVAPEKIVNIRQVHGDKVVVIRDRSPEGDVPVEADALVTNVLDVALAIRTADCLPVYLYDRLQKVIGLVHAGWRGSQKEIVLKAVEVMQREWGTRVEDLSVTFGPAIRSCCYQVGAEFEEIFPDAIRREGESLFLDLATVNRQQLMSVGVFKDAFREISQCTCCEEEFFSYRRQGEGAGRHLSLFVLR
ncbi:MAG: peptidoglycan editing factor PgeF [Candidatus Omnitrophica bacterium]|nr:peptidoglycan editing factor PgeF [Candidatus Omnitrophota bacterium]